MSQETICNMPTALQHVLLTIDSVLDGIDILDDGTECWWPTMKDVVDMLATAKYAKTMPALRVALWPCTRLSIPDLTDVLNAVKRYDMPRVTARVLAMVCDQNTPSLHSLYNANSLECEHMVAAAARLPALPFLQWLFTFDAFRRSCYRDAVVRGALMAGSHEVLAWVATGGIVLSSSSSVGLPEHFITFMIERDMVDAFALFAKKEQNNNVLTTWLNIAHRKTAEKIITWFANHKPRSFGTVYMNLSVFYNVHFPTVN